MKVRYLHLGQGGRTGWSQHLAECEEDYWAASIITKRVTWRQFYWALKNGARAGGSDRVYGWAMMTDTHHPSSNETGGSKFTLSNNRWPLSRIDNHLQQNHNWLGLVSDCSAHHTKRLGYENHYQKKNKKSSCWKSVVEQVIVGPHYFRACRELFENPQTASIQSLNVIRFIKCGHKKNILIMIFFWTHPI